MGGMWHWIKQNWREVVGWIVIVFLFLAFKANGDFHHIYGGLQDTFETFEAIAILIVIILGWLWLNRKKD